MRSAEVRPGSCALVPDRGALEWIQIARAHSSSDRMPPSGQCIGCPGDLLTRGPAAQCQTHRADGVVLAIVALLLLDGITFFDPVGPKVVRQDQNAQARETHLSQRFECRPEVWTVIKWAAPAVDDEIGRSRKALCPPPQVTEPLFRGRRAVQRCAWNVPVSIQKSRSGADDHGLVRPSGAREFMNEVSGPDRVRGRPRLRRGCRSCRSSGPCSRQAQESGRNDRRKPDSRP